MGNEELHQRYETETGEIEEEFLYTDSHLLNEAERAQWLITAPEAESLEYGTGAAAKDLKDRVIGSTVTWIYRGTNPANQVYEEYIAPMEFTNGIVFYTHEDESFVTGTSKYTGGLAAWTSEDIPQNVPLHHRREPEFESFVDQVCESTVYVVQSPKVKERYWEYFGPQIARLYHEDE